MVLPAEIEAAHHRIAPYIRETPVLTLDGTALGLPATLSLKLEFMQHTGSFKPRGAFNRLLSASVPDVGVIAASGGNHGIAVAYVAQQLGYPAEIFVPRISSPVKIERLRAYGATVQITGETYTESLEASQRRVEETGALVVHAYDQPETLAGQGTLACEWEVQTPDLDTVIISVGGGGLIGGATAWLGDRVKVIGVEPCNSACFTAALKAGKPVDADVSGVAADSLGPRRVGELMFAVAQRYDTQCLLVSDEAIIAAQRLLWQELRLAVEPGGAAAFAALTSEVYCPEPGERVGVLLCGSNMDLSVLM